MSTLTTAPPVPTPAPARPDTGFRPEVEGLRAVAVLLVAVYHVWFNRVSGGVDVFLFLTGFFITGSLTRSVERTGSVRAAYFLSRLAHRLLPTAAVVMAGTLAAAYLWLPASRWPAVFDETTASLLYYENWALAAKAVDYLARDGAPSPLQHFWSLSIQGQFYLLWTVLVAFAAVLVRTRGVRLREAVLLLCAMVFAVSLTYSVVTTGTRQAWAYFDTGARLWELALGGMFALALPYLRLPRAVRVPLGWFGLAALLSCGALLEVSTLFPGAVALWPVGAAACVVLAGSTGLPFAADRLLTWRPVMRLGAWSYALYLWHWPILVVYLHRTGRETATLAGGAAVLAAALVLAAATTWLVEGRVNAFMKRRKGRRWSLAAAAVFAVPLLVATLGAQYVYAQRHGPDWRELAADRAAYPGAAVLTDPALAAGLEDAPFLPPLDDVLDLPVIYAEGCDAGLDGTEAVPCSYGDPDAEHTVAIVGGSRIAHWFPAFHGAALDAGWRLVSITKSGCQFSTETPRNDDAEEAASCVEWNEQVVGVLDELRPDLVVTLSSRAFLTGENTYPGFADRWRMLDDWGVQVLALRDLPRLEEPLPECVERESVAACTTPVGLSRSDADPAGEYPDVPANVAFGDLVEYVCPDGTCPAVTGNVLTFRDHSHLTATYSATLAPYVGDLVREVTGW
ncbi:Peptidoglycan/LPS O-acetylase OafA/YrhL, contains acyltransferase and SGNH-hydrolase domains [Glycomyces sambucus]|uniref:Peptidoglycan/LPS O-acetylase OafA/YrhL, contains acyltransferase and SGNH-hydrolase domains n=1 Tax=Glycomyces sambucus TaxID=380244 RepID=A0A1G9GNS3_9ACTN|nr:acyltransferase family protein [Glycomyces sambucus]SDL02324.1 Peptidoglycan/LPS O-acetylase OafA/YrhL, contains acyltransferase and SGNH-hydrolase domains [Glycomyces sambucus]